MKRLALGLVAAVLALAAAPAPAAAQPAAPQGPPRVVLAVDGILQPRNLPVLLADRLGYFRDQGLLVTLAEGRDDVPTEDQLADGRVDGSAAFWHHTIMGQANGHDLQSVVVMGISPALKLVVARRLQGQVRTVADLRGKRIYAGGPNSGKTTTANWLMLRGGGRITDYTSLAPTTAEQMAQAMRSGQADAVVAHEPDASFYVSSGAGYVLADVNSAAGARASLGGLFPSTSIYMTRAYVQAHPEIVQRLVNASLQALRYINTHTAEQLVQVLPKPEDPATYLRVIAEDKQMFATDGLLNPADARQEWQVMAALTPKYRGIDFDRTYTNVFVQRALGGR
jgi:NitT/TauT family transport system substrate-binding protein